VVRELIGNAIDAVRGVRDPGVFVSVQPDDSGQVVRVSVADNGTGISEDGALHLASEFFCSSKADSVGGAVGTYGVGLKGALLWAALASQSLGVSHHGMVIRSRHQPSCSNVTIVARILWNERGDPEVEANTTVAHDASLERSSTTVAMELPIDRWPALAKLLSLLVADVSVSLGTVPVEWDIPGLDEACAPRGGRLAEVRETDCTVETRASLVFVSRPGVAGEGALCDATRVSEQVSLRVLRSVNGIPLGNEGCSTCDIVSAVQLVDWGMFGLSLGRLTQDASSLRPVVTLSATWSGEPSERAPFEGGDFVSPTSSVLVGLDVVINVQGAIRSDSLAFTDLVKSSVSMTNKGVVTRCLTDAMREWQLECPKLLASVAQRENERFLARAVRSTCSSVCEIIRGMDAERRGIVLDLLRLEASATDDDSLQEELEELLRSTTMRMLIQPMV
jgi:hypothetical protein